MENGVRKKGVGNLGGFLWSYPQWRKSNTKSNYTKRQAGSNQDAPRKKRPEIFCGISILDDHSLNEGGYAGRDEGDRHRLHRVQDGWADLSRASHHDRYWTPNLRFQIQRRIHRYATSRADELEDERALHGVGQWGALFSIQGTRIERGI